MRASLIAAAAFGAVVYGFPAQAQEEPSFQFSFNPTPSMSTPGGVCYGGNPYCINHGNGSGPGGGGGNPSSGGSGGRGCSSSPS